MNIVVVLSNTDEQINNVLTGWGFALNALGHNLIMYHGQTPIFRIFDQYRPELLIMSAQSINKTYQKVVKEFTPETLVFFKKNDEFSLHIEGSKEIGVLDSTDVKEGQYYSQYGWDAVNYSPKKKDEKYKSKYAYVGRYNPALQDTFDALGGDLRIYSPDVHNSLSYVGHDENKPAIFASADNVLLDENDTDHWNVEYSKEKFDKFSESYDGGESYFHRILSLGTRACLSDNILTTKLLEKVKEVEDENRLGSQ